MRRVLATATVLVAVLGCTTTAFAADTTTLVSRGADGTQANNHSSFPQVSGDGHVVAFTSSASNLVAGDTNGKLDVFVRDLDSGVIERVSVGDAEEQGDDHSRLLDISRDGRLVLFESSARSLSPAGGDNNQLFLRDRVAGTTEWLTAPRPGLQSVGLDGRMSADGNVIAYWAAPTDQGPSNSATLLGLIDRAAGTVSTERFDLSPFLGFVRVADISADGRYVVLITNVSKAAADSDTVVDPYVYDRVTGTFELFRPANTMATSWYTMSLSADGRFVTMPAADLDGSSPRLVVRDRSSGQDTVVDAEQGAITDDGRFLVLGSDRPLVPEDTNGAYDLFLHDRVTGATRRVTVAADGSQIPSGGGGLPRGSADGSVVPFEAFDSAAIPGDTNNFVDAFARDMRVPTTPALTIGQRITNLIDHTLDALGLPSLRAALRGYLETALNAAAGNRPAATCAALRLYELGVQAAPPVAFSSAEKLALRTESRSIRADLGC